MVNIVVPPPTNNEFEILDKTAEDVFRPVNDALRILPKPGPERGEIVSSRLVLADPDHPHEHVEHGHHHQQKNIQKEFALPRLQISDTSSSTKSKSTTDSLVEATALNQRERVQLILSNPRHFIPRGGLRPFQKPGATVTFGKTKPAKLQLLPQSQLFKGDNDLLLKMRRQFVGTINPHGPPYLLNFRLLPATDLESGKEVQIPVQMIETNGPEDHGLFRDLEFTDADQVILNAQEPNQSIEELIAKIKASQDPEKGEIIINLVPDEEEGEEQSTATTSTGFSTTVGVTATEATTSSTSEEVPTTFKAAVRTSTASSSSSTTEAETTVPTTESETAATAHLSTLGLSAEELQDPFSEDEYPTEATESTVQTTKAEVEEVSPSTTSKPVAVASPKFSSQILQTITTIAQSQQQQQLQQLSDEDFTKEVAKEAGSIKEGPIVSRSLNGRRHHAHSHNDVPEVFNGKRVRGGRRFKQVFGQRQRELRKVVGTDGNAVNGVGKIIGRGRNMGDVRDRHQGPVEIDGEFR